MSGRFNQAYRVRSDTTIDVAFWNRVFLDLDTRIVGIEEKKADYETAEKIILEIGLERINSILLPAAERVFRVAELGFLVASSDEAGTFVEGQEASLTVREGDQRELFTPSPFVALTRRSTTADYAIARTISYDAGSGVFLFKVETVVGSGGPHDDWDIAALAGSVMAMNHALDETRALRAAVANDRADAVSAKEAATLARDETAGHLATFLRVYRGPLAAPPPEGEIGHFYFDTTLGQTRIYTEDGWGPLYSVAFGGIRQGLHIASAEQTAFSAGGEFDLVSVFRNGVLLVPGVDYTAASPNFTLSAGAAAGDVVSYLAYTVTEQ